MLVLALQFSKGVASVGIVRTRSPDTLRQWSSKLMPCEKGQPLRAGSLKTEEKTKSVDLIVKEDGSSTSHSSRLNPPMHQLGTGSNRTGHALAVSERYADQRLNSSSLERR